MAFVTINNRGVSLNSGRSGSYPPPPGPGRQPLPADCPPPRSGDRPPIRSADPGGLAVDIGQVGAPELEPPGRAALQLKGKVDGAALQIERTCQLRHTCQSVEQWVEQALIRRPLWRRRPEEIGIPGDRDCRHIVRPESECRCGPAARLGEERQKDRDHQQQPAHAAT